MLHERKHGFLRNNATALGWNVSTHISAVVASSFAEEISPLAFFTLDRVAHKELEDHLTHGQKNYDSD